MNTAVAMNVVPRAKLRSAKTVKSRIGSFTVSSRHTNATSAHAATTLRLTINRESNQSSRWPQSRVSCRQPKPRTMSTRPPASMRPGLRWCGESNRKALASRKPSTPIGRLM